MKASIFVFLFLILTSCSFFDQQAKIEFDNNRKTIRVVSENFKIAYIFIRETGNTVPSDSAYTSIDFEKPVKEISLKQIKAGQYSGQPINTTLDKEDLEYNIVLKGNLDGHGIDRSICFKSKDSKTNKIFFSEF